ncbi:hypothetical protein [Novosphingobium sp. ES2-1]|uniref:hypothetical protein n=1 Tax=Novosphingobium sp. ES2-1 TaxID=2780074 RepID=UPI0018820836|nr:hypothetical protein [Novosphingobium sp. ES2-1]QOV94228.1 hypothetical protein IM701_01665 [Novosphingobium sp. ES2-1]
MRKSLFTLIYAMPLLCTACADKTLSTNVASEISELEALRSQHVETCSNGTNAEPYYRKLSERERALAEWDAIAGEDLDSISADQEWEIRRSIGDQMGLAPSQVNGWKSIYKARQEQAKRLLAEATPPSDAEIKKYRDEIRSASCKTVKDIDVKMVILNDRLSRSIEDENKAWWMSFGKSIAIFFGIIGSLFIVFRRSDTKIGAQKDLQSENLVVTNPDILVNSVNLSAQDQEKLNGLIERFERLKEKIPADGYEKCQELSARKEVHRLQSLVTALEKFYA